MIFSLDKMKSIDPEGIWLEISPAEIEQQTKQSEDRRYYTNETSSSNALLNQICLDKVADWLKSQGIEYQSSLSLEERRSIWDVVTGCALQIGNARLILVPSEDIDRDELSVPQEWVDLPHWLGDYYLAVQIDLESRLMNIWGFTSHRTLKEKGEYNSIDRSYSLDSNLLIDDLDVLFISQDLGLREIARVEELPTLSLDRALELIKELSVPSPYSPRFKLDFGQWGAILDSPNLRQQLYKTRLQEAAIASKAEPTFRLIEWLDNNFKPSIENGWMPVPVGDYRTNEIEPTKDIERTKIVDLQANIHQVTVRILVGIIRESEGIATISIRVLPVTTKTLPPQLELSCLYEDKSTISTPIVTRNNDILIQHSSFSCPIGSKFTIQLRLYDAEITEDMWV